MGEMEIFSVDVRNVQSIESLKFEFPQRESGGSFVTFVGPSSSGKSALLRAVHALVNNTSTAAVLLRAGAKSFEVGAETKQGRVAIERGSSLSTYKVGEEAYTKAGTSVPEDVQKALGFKDPDMHLRFQFDRPYLLDLTSGQAASVLSRLSNAHILRDAAAKASKIVRKATSDLTVLEGEKVAAQAALEGLGDVEARGEQVAGLNSALDAVYTLVSEAAGVQQAVSTYYQRTGAVQAAQAALVDVPDLSEQFDEIRYAGDWVAKVQHYIEVCRRCKPLAVPVESVAGYAYGDVVDLQQKISRFNEALVLVDTIQQIQQEEVPAAHERAKADVRDIEAKIAHVRSTLEICPTCGQEVV